jgi:hypothetical protein
MIFFMPLRPRYAAIDLDGKPSGTASRFARCPVVTLIAASALVLSCGDAVTGQTYPAQAPPSGGWRPGYPVNEIQIHGPDAGHEPGCYGDPSCRAADAGAD